MAERPQITKMLIWPMAFTPETFSDAYIIGKSTVYEEIKAGRLIARKVGRSTIILASDAEEWAQSQRIEETKAIPESLSDVGLVYFIRAGSSGPIKIGKANNVQARLAGLQTAQHEKLIVLGWIPGGMRIERSILNRFLHLRIRGEWHRAAPELLKFISRCACHG